MRNGECGLRIGWRHVLLAGFIITCLSFSLYAEDSTAATIEKYLENNASTEELRQSLKAFVSSNALGSVQLLKRLHADFLKTKETLDPKTMPDAEIQHTLSLGSVVHTLIETMTETKNETFGPPIYIVLCEPRNFRIKHASCYAMGVLKYKPAEKTLIGLLSDKMVDIRASAVFALGMLGKIEPLKNNFNLLSDKETRVVWETADVLGRHFNLNLKPLNRDEFVRADEADYRKTVLDPYVKELLIQMKKK